MAAYHDPTTTTASLRTVAQRTEQRRGVAGTVIGTSIEWYDYFLYASAAGLFFTTLFFEPLGLAHEQVQAQSPFIFHQKNHSNPILNH